MWTCASMQISIKIVPIFRILRNLFPLKSAKDLLVKRHSFLLQCLEFWIAWRHCIEHWNKADLTVSCKGTQEFNYYTFGIKDVYIVFIFIAIVFTSSNHKWHPEGVLFEEKVTLFEVLLSRISFKLKQATCSMTTLESFLCSCENKTLHQFSLVIPR